MIFGYIAILKHIETSQNTSQETRKSYPTKDFKEMDATLFFLSNDISVVDMNIVGKKIIINECTVGFTLNHFHLFLGRWSLEDVLFKVHFIFTVMILNHHIRRSGRPPITLHISMEGL